MEYFDVRPKWQPQVRCAGMGGDTLHLCVTAFYISHGIKLPITDAATTQALRRWIRFSLETCMLAHVMDHKPQVTAANHPAVKKALGYYVPTWKKWITLLDGAYLRLFQNQMESFRPSCSVPLYYLQIEVPRPR